MFPIENTSELSDTQSLFLSWIEKYDWVSSLLPNEKPSDNVIEDDFAFDAWYKGYVAAKMSEARSSASSSGRSKKTASSHKNVIQF